MFLGCLWLPESPSWLVSRGACEDAREVLVRLRGTTDVNEELQVIQTVCKEQESYDKKSKFVKYWRVGVLIDSSTRSVKFFRVVLFEFDRSRCDHDTILKGTPSWIQVRSRRDSDVVQGRTPA